MLTNLCITDEERKMICSAMGFAGKGHWYKCQNGHIYCITECGGATETSKCLECKSDIGELLSRNCVNFQIFVFFNCCVTLHYISIYCYVFILGGTSHRLLEDNRIASEMDGVTRPAYDPMDQNIPNGLMADLWRQGFR